jgi:hypothetical protein
MAIVADEKKHKKKGEKEVSKKVFVRITFIIGALSVHLTFMYIITLSPSIAACASLACSLLSLPLISYISLNIDMICSEFMNLINSHKTSSMGTIMIVMMMVVYKCIGASTYLLSYYAINV